MTDIKSLAQHLDISIGTVSRALNDKPDVSPKTRERVLAAAQELGYVPNQSGRSLRKGATQTIGIVINSGQGGSRSGDDFFLSVVDSAQRILAEQKYDVIILPCHSADDPTNFLRRVIQRGIVDALILTGTRVQDPRIEFLEKNGTPFLTLGRSETAGQYSWVDLDFEHFVTHSINHLVGLGHSRIAISLPDSDVNLGYVMQRSYQDALSRNGIELDPKLTVKAEQNEYGGTVIAQTLLELDSPPTALLLAHEPSTIGVYSYLRHKGLRPGVDLSIVCLRQDPQLRFLDPAVSAFAFSLDELGLELGKEILNVIRKAGPPMRKRWPMEFRPTSSIGPKR